MPKGAGSGMDPAVLRWLSWAIGLLAIGSAFAPMSPELMRGLHWVLAVFGLLEAGVAIGRGRRGPFFVYAALVVLVNPVRPFSFPPQFWRLLHAAAGIWLIGDHLPGKKK
jgi:hypothetical protein